MASVQLKEHNADFDSRMQFIYKRYIRSAWILYVCLLVISIIIMLIAEIVLVERFRQIPIDPDAFSNAFYSFFRNSDYNNYFHYWIAHWANEIGIPSIIFLIIHLCYVVFFIISKILFQKKVWIQFIRWHQFIFIFLNVFEWLFVSYYSFYFIIWLVYEKKIYFIIFTLFVLITLIIAEVILGKANSLLKQILIEHLSNSLINHPKTSISVQESLINNSSQELLFCSKCGLKKQDGFGFCPKCGTKFL